MTIVSNQDAFLLLQVREPLHRSIRLSSLPFSADQCGKSSRSAVSAVKRSERREGLESQSRSIEARHAYGSRFLSHCQRSTCLNYHVEPTNPTVTTPFKAMTQTSLRDHFSFKNVHSTPERVLSGESMTGVEMHLTRSFPPAELTECPTCASLPDLSTPRQLSRAKNLDPR